MSYYREELAMVAENREPLSFDEAFRRGTEGKKLVFVSPTKEMADARFRAYVAFLSKELIQKVKTSRIILWNDAELLFLTDWEIEHHALRGLGRVVWIG